MKSIESRAVELLDAVRERRDVGKRWIEIHNEMFGIAGRFHQLFPDEAERIQAGKTDAFNKAWDALTELHKQENEAKSSKIEPATKKANGNLSIRLPAALHAALLAEADAEGCSLNQLVTVKLAVQLREAVRKS